MGQGRGGPTQGRWGSEGAVRDRGGGATRKWLRVTAVHVRYVFDEAGGPPPESSTKSESATRAPRGRAFQVEAYFALQFEALRELLFPGDAPEVSVSAAMRP